MNFLNQRFALNPYLFALVMNKHFLGDAFCKPYNFRHESIPSWKLGEMLWNLKALG